MDKIDSRAKGCGHAVLPKLAQKCGAALAMALLAACGGGGGGSGPAAGADPGPTPPAAAFTLMGTIRAPIATLTDSDVNDPNAPYQANDARESAQPSGNPMTIGGYVNVAGAGAAGRSQATGDVHDFFSMELAAGDTVTLFIAESGAGDVDLVLRNERGEIVDASAGVSEYEQLAAPAGGSYFVEVLAYSGASSYVLSAGRDQAMALRGSLRLGADFVPGELIVRYRKSAAQAQALSRFLAFPSGTVTLSVAAGAAGNDQLVRLEDPRAYARSAAPGHGGAGDERFASDALKSRWQTLQAIKALRHDAAVEYAEPNYIWRAFGLAAAVIYAVPADRAQPDSVASDPDYRDQWHYPLINLPSAWDITRGAPDVTVAVIDTGVALAHPDLQGQLVEGFDFISDATNALDGDGIDPNPDDPGDQYPYGGSSFHGTHVAGTIAAATNNGEGVAGVAGGVRIMPLRVLGRWGGSSYDINQALRYAAGLGNDSGRVPARRVDVINLSLGCSNCPPSAADQAAFDDVRRQGVIVVAAAGNDADDIPNYPAAYEGVISVAAVRPDREAASYSSYGSTVDVAAPGGDFTDLNNDYVMDGILSTWVDDSGGVLQMTYGYMMGTSMASPHVAGVIALMKSVNPGLTPEQADQLLASGAMSQDLGAPGRDERYGFGLIDAARAVLAARDGSGPPLPPAIVAMPVALDFNAVESVKALAVAANNTGARVTAVTADVPWLQIAGSSLNEGQLGVYQIRVDRTALPVGMHRATIRVESDANTVTVPVTVQVRAQATEGDAGLQYVALVDAASGRSIAETLVAPQRGTYQYRFDDVAPGTYEIWAGTDMDNDSRICEAGEACGQYGANGAAVSVRVSRNESGLDFDTRFVTDAAARTLALTRN